MADYKKIDDFSEASAFEDTDKLLVSKAKVTYTILGSKIKAFCQAAISTLVAQVNSDATAAANAKTAAQTAQTNAETANTNAQDAKTAALSAKTDAQTAASTATAAAAAMQECAAYSASKSYIVGNMCVSGGSTYRCTSACTGVQPPNTSYWLCIAAKGADGTGTGDMQSSVYDPAGGAKQVAFANGDASNMTAAFTSATTRANLTTGENLSVLFGKLSKWFADLKTVAFSGSYSDLSEKPTSLPASDVYSWAKASTKPTYTASEVGADASGLAVSTCNTRLNRTTNVNTADTNYTTLMARGIGLVSADTTPTVNGGINLTYG